MYPSTTSKSSVGDPSSESSAGPSHKRCRSLAAIVTSSIHATRALVPSRVNLLPPRKRFRDSISVEDSVEEDIDTNVLEDIEADAMAIEVAVDRDVVTVIDAGIDMEVDVGVDVKDKVEKEVESSDRGTIEVRVDVTAGINILDAMLMPDVVERLEQEALAAYEATHVANALEAESQSQNGNDGDNGNGRNGNGRNGNGGDGNGRDGNGRDRNGGNGNPNENSRGSRHVARECTYQDFMSATSQLHRNGRSCQVDKNLTVKNNDLATYTQRFQELTMICTKMVPGEEDWVEKFIKGLPDNIQGNNVGGQNVVRAYTAGNNERRAYNGLLPLCNKGKYHHEGPCTVKCSKCQKVGHLTRDCKAADSTTSNQRGQVVNQRVLTCFECRRKGHYKGDCPKLKDQNHGNKKGNKNGVGEVKGKAYVLGGGDANPDSNIITDVSYAVELAYGRISETNTVLRGCTLGLLGHPFNIDLMPVELGSFDVIIGMDWLVNHHAVIVCDEKIIRIPYEDKILIVQERLPDFLAQIKKKETEDKSEEKRLEDVPTVRDFPEAFPKDLPRLPPSQQLEFQIDLVPSVAPVACAPYRLAQTELQELSTQLQELSDKGFIRPSSLP
ncbi:putative reverse transcriptase domain-containing protein [Tanacetum coccineum]